MTHVTVLIEEDNHGVDKLYLPRKTKIARLAFPSDRKVDTVRVGCDDGSYIFANIMNMVPEDENASKPEQKKRR